MGKLINLDNTGKYFYRSEFYSKHDKHLGRIEAWHIQCNGSNVSTSTVDKDKKPKGVSK
jgi:hypothetical protein